MPPGGASSSKSRPARSSAHRRRLLSSPHARALFDVGARIMCLVCVASIAAGNNGCAASPLRAGVRAFIVLNIGAFAAGPMSSGGSTCPAPGGIFSLGPASTSLSAGGARVGGAPCLAEGVCPGRVIDGEPGSSRVSRGIVRRVTAAAGANRRRCHALAWNLHSQATEVMALLAAICNHKSVYISRHEISGKSRNMRARKRKRRSRGIIDAKASPCQYAMPYLP